MQGKGMVGIAVWTLHDHADFCASPAPKLLLKACLCCGAGILPAFGVIRIPRIMHGSFRGNINPRVARPSG